jgi:hypothetical protein
MCHTGTAHGWKNKAFLANLNDLGPEILAIGGETAPGNIALLAGNTVPKGTTVTPVIPTGYSNGPYYRGTLLAIDPLVGFPKSGEWTKTSCKGCHI